MKDEVRNTYKQYLKLDGRRVLLKIPEFYREDGLKFLVNSSVTAVLIPLSDGVRSTLHDIEYFVQTNVVSEKYKPLWLRESMYVNLSKWCKYFLVDVNGMRRTLPEGTCLGKGSYSFEIQASHVYIGPHKSGETFSLSLHVTEVLYRPNDMSQEIMQLVRTLESSPSTSQPILTSKQPILTSIIQTPKIQAFNLAKSKQRKGRKSTKALDEVDC